MASAMPDLPLSYMFRQLTGTKLHFLVSGAPGCVQLAHSCYAAVTQRAVNPATS